MSLNKRQIKLLATKLIRTHNNKKLIPALSLSYDYSMDEAYKIQRMVIDHEISQGRKIIGWKLGYTSIAMRNQMNVSEPNYGPLLDNMILPSGSTISRNLVQPKVEPEIALSFQKHLHGSFTFKQVTDAIDKAYIALEVVDSVYKNYSFKIEDNTADRSSAAQFVLGPVINHDALDETDIIFNKNGETIAKCKGSAASGHPLNGILWLIKRLEKQGSRIETGQIIITGGLTSAVDINNGDLIEAITADSKKVQAYG